MSPIGAEDAHNVLELSSTTCDMNHWMLWTQTIQASQITAAQLYKSDDLRAW